MRAGHRLAATNLIRRIEELLAAGTTDVQKLSQLKLSLSEKLDNLKTLDTDLLDLIEDEATIAEEIVEADKFKETIYAAMVILDRALASQPVTTGSTVTPPTVSVPTPTTRAVSRVKLPKLTIPPFNGELTAWPPFWESYEAAIHTNSDLSDAEKFNYLRSLLRQTALDSVSGLALIMGRLSVSFVLVLETNSR